jgi:hypothetical protein
MPMTTTTIITKRRTNKFKLTTKWILTNCNKDPKDQDHNNHKSLKRKKKIKKTTTTLSSSNKRAWKKKKNLSTV